MAKKGGGDYFGLSWTVSLVLAIIPITSLVCGVVTRVLKGKLINIVGAVLNVVVFPVFWIADIVTMILNKKIILLAT